MIDSRLKICLSRWPGELPEAIHAEAVRLEAYVLASIARVCRLNYQRDKWGDRWKTPDETWDDRGGDCEDIAILSGSMLKAIFPHMTLELVLCWKAGTRQGHAVLCAHGSGGEKYIDNEYRRPYGPGEFAERYEEHSRTKWPE